ncbi:Hypothetical protein PHPALM_14676 [Phytophthora palmivora]|uniref:Uncharacterized protein n=1 Tax=Phytophthora palmivora TaxID=4796 RepID=A0A2P4XUC0_9STRA|nr:Hypothetical protein PHPALM_14676 [Phytophthora palmivora]
MTLGPSSAAMLRQRGDQEAKRMVDVIAPTMAQGSNVKLESYFQEAMSRFLKEQQGTINPARSALAADRDVDMESVGSLDRHPSPHEYDPDDLDLDPPRRATVGPASATTTGSSTSVPRIRVSVMSELKEFVGKEGDKDRVRAWLNKIKLQTKKSVWCSAISSQDQRETGIDSLVAQHAVPGRIYSVASRFNIVDEECQSRGNITMRARDRTNLRWSICTGSMWQDSGPASRSRMDLRKFDVNTWSTSSKLLMTAILQITWPYYEVQTLTLWKKHFDLGNERRHDKPRQKNHSAAAPSASTRAVRAVKAISDSSEYEEDSSGSDDEARLRRVYLAASGKDEGQQVQEQRNQDRSRSEAGNNLNQLIDPIDNTCDFLEKSTATVSRLRQIDEYARSSVMMALEISPEESRGCWKYHVPVKKFKQSKAMK